MPLSKIELRPGINKMATPTKNEGGVSDGNLIRFRQGLPEKIKGWSRFFTAAPSTVLLGVCRALLNFASLAGDVLLGAGTNNHLYVSRGGVLYDVTPLDRTLSVAANAISSVNGSVVVTVSTGGTPHSLSAGDFFTFDTIAGQVRTAATIAFNGLSLGGVDYMVTSVGSTTAFSFSAANAANATGTYPSTATVQCYLPAGPADATPGLGYGAGGYGVAGYGLAAAQAATTLPARMWSLDTWGEWMMAVPTQGPLLVFKPASTGAIDTRAVVVTNATPANGPPLTNGGMCVGMPERHVILFGCSALNSTSTYDPLLVRFSDVEDSTNFLATVTNSAGSFRLQGGSRIMGWLNSTLQTLVWTDIALWQMRFIGLPAVYSFNKLDGGSCGLIGQNARCELGGAVYWMSPSGFWKFSGGAPQQLPCTLQDTVFEPSATDASQGINRAQQQKTVCAVNSANGEVSWFWPSNAGTEIDSYVTLNTQEGTWYGGKLARTAWVDRGGGLSLPLGVSPSGVLFNHETGTDADGAAMGETMETGYFDIEDGEQLMLISALVPDFQNFAGTLSLYVKLLEWPNSTPRVMGPYIVTAGTKQIPLRARARQAALRFVGGGVGSNWRLGAMRANTQPDGQR